MGVQYQEFCKMHRGWVNISFEQHLTLMQTKRAADKEHHLDFTCETCLPNICETCADAMDDTSVLSLADHECEGECSCACNEERKLMFIDIHKRVTGSVTICRRAGGSLDKFLTDDWEAVTCILCLSLLLRTLRTATIGRLALSVSIC